ncbi:hypothetical protein HK104_006781 [Borealophlyctis nickersoniae]|nr:hypothetical protein HK104_006781 [Borealophlyctis nickersoniae]
MSSNAATAAVTPKADLPHLRDRIDSLDSEIVRLLNERANVSINIGLVKKNRAQANGTAWKDEHIHVPSREQEIYERIQKLNHGPLPTPAIHSIFREIMSASISLQRDITIAFLGPRGTYSHQVAFARFGDSVQYVEQDTIEDVFDAVESGTVTYGVVPFENSTHGSVVQTLDRFVSGKPGGVMVRAEDYLPIHNALLVAAGTTRDQITKVYSHAQALGQCKTYLSTHLKHALRVPVPSTAHAATLAAQEPGTAAISSAVCADLYNLTILDPHIEDLKNNTTRFLILGTKSDPLPPSPQPHIQHLTLLFFTVDHRQPGALCDALAEFKKRGINLTRIESRPSRVRNWHYVFFIELVGHYDSPGVKEAIEGLKAFCLDVRVLGSYPSQRDKGEGGGE